MDRVSRETRSRIMSSIRSRDTKMELAVRPALEALGFAYHPKGIRGSPDFARLDKRIAVFLDGCWWHGCPEHCRVPEANREFWAAKIARNRERDAEVTARLEAEGWLVIRIWEHDLRKVVPK